MEVVAPALELIGGEVFELLSISVTQAVERKTVFQSLLIEMKTTLIHLRSQSDVIREIREFNVELRLPYHDITNLETEMTKGRELVEKLELMTFHFWNFCCNNVYADQLNHLNGSLKRLLESLSLQRGRDVMEILKLSRQNQENRDKDRKDADEMLALLRKTDQQNQIIMMQNEILINHLPQQIAGENLMETLASGSASNTGNEANGEEVISFEGVKTAFKVLFDAVTEAQDKKLMYEPLFGDLKSTLVCLKPFVDEMEHNKVLNRPWSELENFKIQMEEGVEIVHKCSRNCLLAKFKRNTYTNKLYGLDQSLNRQFNIMMVQVAKDVMETSNSIKHIQEVVRQIKRSGILKNQLETNEGSCQVPEGAVQETMDVEEGLGSEQSTMADLVAEPPVQETMDVEEGLGSKQSTMADLVAEPPVQETTDEIKEVSVSTSDVEESLGATPGSDGSDVFGGAGGGRLFNVLYDLCKELISKSIIYKPLLKDIESTLDSNEPLIKQIESCNEELGLPQEEVEKFKSLMNKGMEIVEKCVEKCSEVRKWNIYKKYKYANKLIGWQDALVRQLDIIKVQKIRGVKEILISEPNKEEQVSQTKSSQTSYMAGVEQIASTSGNVEKELNEIRIHSFNIMKGVGRIDSRGVMKNERETLCELPELPSFTLGLDVPLKELKMKLLKDDQMSTLVVTAPGGCGKTILATKFCQDEEVKGKFKNIFFITVSKDGNLDLIVRELYQREGYSVPTFQDEESAVKWLQKFLKEKGQNPLLLVLDDVWSGSLLEKFELDMPDYKILVTSRSEFRRFGSTYYLPLLDFDDAMKLFHHSASLGDKSSHIPPDISRKIVEGCMGFPLAIRVAGSSLCGQSTEVWVQRLIQWSKGSSILDSEIQLLLCLQSSLDTLTREMFMAKECFLDLGSFPQDKRIPVSALIDMWAESYDPLDEDILCVALLHKLTNQSLANFVFMRKDQMEGDGYYGEHFVIQHGLLRELAIYETRQEDPGHRERLIINITGNDFPRWWREQKYERMKARLLSISTDAMFSTKWHTMELPEVEVLVLNFQTKNYAVPEFVDKMVKLKVLVVTNYGFLPCELTNFHLLHSSPNLKRIRLEHISIPSITKNCIELKSLQKISLFMCNIGQAFSNGSIQLSHALPNLVEVNIDYCNDLVELPADICDLIHLKKISITNCFNLLALPEEIGKLANLEVLRLRSCIALEKLPSSSGNLKKLNFLDISYCFSIKELPEDIGEMSSLSKLNIRECLRLQEVPVSVVDLKQLKEVICDREIQSLWNTLLTAQKQT